MVEPGCRMASRARLKSRAPSLGRLEPAMALMEKEFSPRVLEAIARLNPDLTPGTGEGRTYPPRNGYCERDFIVTLNIPNTINLKRNPWR